MLITVALLLFKREDKMEFNWSSLRDFQSKSYIMPQPTELFCHIIFLAKFSMLLSFSPHFLPNIEGAYTLIRFSSRAKA